MSAITAQIHIDTASSAGDRTFPATPIPYTGSQEQLLTPSTELRIPLTSAQDKPQQLASLADAMDASRANLNRILTSWKDWMGKEEVPAFKAGKDDDEEEEEEDDDEEE